MFFITRGSNFLFWDLLTTILPFFVFFALLRFVVQTFRADPRLVKFASSLPGPHALPVLGNTLDFLRTNTEGKGILKKCEDEFGSKYRLWFGKHLAVVLTDSQDLESVFSSSNILNKPPFLVSIIRDLWKEALFTLVSSEWKQGRRAIQPFFSRNPIIQMIPSIQEIILHLVTEMKTKVDGPEFNLWDVLPYFTFDIITKLLFNATLSIEEKKNIVEMNTFTLADEIFFSKLFKFWEQNKVIDFMLHSRQKRIFNRRTRKLIAQLVEKRKREGSESQTDLFLHIVKLKNTLNCSDEYIQNIIIGLLSAGIEEVALTLSYCIVALAMHPQIQDKVYEELYEKFGEDDQMAVADDLEFLPYLDQVLRESQRRFTVVPTVYRNIDKDTKIGDVIFPSGTAILIPINSIHMSGKYYANPLKFDPEHFSSNAVKNRPRYAFLPFSAGVRNCLGKVLATVEVKLILISLLREYKFYTTMKMEEMNISSLFLSTSVNGYLVSIKSRKEKTKVV